LNHLGNIEAAEAWELRQNRLKAFCLTRMLEVTLLGQITVYLLLDKVLLSALMIMKNDESITSY
jgi:hypothetical protein